MTLKSGPAESVGQDRLRRLARLAEVLSDAVTVDQVARAVVEAGGEELMADSIAVCLLDEAQQTYRIAASGGLRPDLADAWASFPADAPVPVVDAVARRRLVAIEGPEQRERLYPVFGEGPITSETLLVAPMLVHGETAIGALSLGFGAGRALHELDRDFVQAAADLCGQAVHRARLFEYQQRTLAGQRFLAEASKVLAGDLDLDRTLYDVASLVTSEIADVCAVCLWDDDGALVPVTAVHRDGDGQEVVDGLVARQPAIRNPDLLEVATNGGMRLVPVVDRAGDAEAAEDAMHLQLIQALDATSAMVVPLSARGRVLGILLLLMTSSSGRSFGESDRDLACDLADRAALAIDNAKLYTERTELVEHLQLALGSHRAIEQAKGVLATRWEMSPTEAFNRMRRHARSTRRKLEDLAEDVVAGRDDLPQ